MAIYLRRKSYYYDFFYKGQRYAGCIGPVSKTVAKEEEARKKAEVIEGRLNPAKTRKSPRFEAFAENYLEWSRANKKPRSYERDITSLVALRQYFSGQKLSDINPWLIEKYKKGRKDQGRSNQTVNLELACLKALFSKAILWGKAAENPVKQVKMLRVNNTRVRFLDEEEEGRLLAQCQDHLRDLVVTALHTGFRRNELVNLRPEDVDFLRGLVHVRAGYAKNGESRAVPMTQTLRGVLERLVAAAQKSGSAYLFRNCHGEPYRSVRTGFEHAVQRAEVRDFHFHDLRHTFASRLVMAGGDIRTVQDLLGHKTIAMTLRYAHLSPSHRQRVMEALERQFPGKSPNKIHNTSRTAPLSKTKKAV